MSHINRTLSILLSLMMLCVCLSAGAETATGVYEGASTGFSGDVVATLTLEDGTMTGLVFDESANANQILTDEQRTDFAQSIIQAGTPLVYTVAGATITSNAMIEATKDALAKAGITEYREAEKVTYSADDISFVPGEYTSTKMGMNGEITVMQYSVTRPLNPLKSQTTWKPRVSALLLSVFLAIIFSQISHWAWIL